MTFHSCFKPAWWGVDLEVAGLGQVRPRVGTYGEYAYGNLPSLPCSLDGGFSWLSGYGPYTDHIGSDDRATGIASSFNLLKHASSEMGIQLPGSFIEFIGNPQLVQRVRTPTDCYLDLCPGLVPSPVGDGFLVRFLADSQACLFWYLHLPENGPEHCVVASPGFYGLPEEQWQDTLPDPDDIRRCAPSFEAFLCRLVLESGIWFSMDQGGALTELEARYLERYRS